MKNTKDTSEKHVPYKSVCKESWFAKGKRKKFFDILKKIKNPFNRPKKYDSASDDKSESTD
ncbi:hypothetical protein [Wolbachia pipientis]|uniref:hypothetical protein n=1 Tax=Wolbachia pipientis TaxID=955 RepID=UPI0025A45B4A|nr:hypothetical protein [Wolbachia pipientis]MDM8335511.1 hypothetical protein [Wolbachia pipientis]